MMSAILYLSYVDPQIGRNPHVVDPIDVGLQFNVHILHAPLLISELLFTGVRLQLGFILDFRAISINYALSVNFEFTFRFGDLFFHLLVRRLCCNTRSSLLSTFRFASSFGAFQNVD